MSVHVNAVRTTAQAVLDARGVAYFSYVDAKGETSQRRVALDDVSDTHLRGHDLDRNAFRTFRIDSVQSIDKTVRLTAASMVAMLKASLLTRTGDVVTDELAEERARNIATGLIGIEVVA